MRGVLILNSGMNAAGEPNPETASRIDAGMDYAQAASIGYVLMVGGKAEAMCAYAEEQHPNGPVARPEARSMDTLEGAHMSKVDFIQPENVSGIDIFTSDFHAWRTGISFRRVYGPHYDLKVHAVPSDCPPEKRAAIKNREQVQLVYAMTKLVGIPHHADAAREKRLEQWRFRGKTNFLARALNALDGHTNIDRSTEPVYPTVVTS